MVRKPTPDGRRVHMNVKFSEAEAALIDEARGTEDRGAWLRRAALAAVERQRPPADPAGRQAEAATPKVPPERLAELRALAAASGIEPASDPAELGRLSIEAHAAQVAAESRPRHDPENCRHENMRLHRGWCPDCETIAVKK